MNEKYTIDIQPVGDDRLQVSVPEIGATVTIESIRRDDALDAAHNLIIEYHLKQRETSEARAS